MCAVLALFRCRIVCCFSVREVTSFLREVRLRGLECAPWFGNGHIQEPVQQCVCVFVGLSLCFISAWV